MAHLIPDSIFFFFFAMLSTFRENKNWFLIFVFIYYYCFIWFGLVMVIGKYACSIWAAKCWHMIKYLRITYNIEDYSPRLLHYSPLRPHFYNVCILMAFNDSKQCALKSCISSSIFFFFIKNIQDQSIFFLLSRRQDKSSIAICSLLTNYVPKESI